MTLHIISAGAAQSVVQQAIDAWQREGHGEIAATYGAVGAQRKQLLDGAAADVVILTATMIDELIASGHIVAGTRSDLGAVVGGIAVPVGATHPDAGTEQALARALCEAAAVYLPDPAIATAGAQFVRMCEQLGIAAAVAPKLRTFPNGFAAMTRMAQERVPGAVGCTQITEIKWVQGVDLVAPLPRSLQAPTTYSLGIGARSANPAGARTFAERLTGGDAAMRLSAAGFGVS
ncbi:MAG: ABC transporter substrate-binding protein [Betaproteobacteria bacterium]|nr:ABC transporter substrate-binding protein [Betaproteobacteria bacterium]